MRVFVKGCSKDRKRGGGRKHSKLREMDNHLELGIWYKKLEIKYSGMCQQR